MSNIYFSFQDMQKVNKTCGARKSVFWQVAESFQEKKLLAVSKKNSFVWQKHINSCCGFFYKKNLNKLEILSFSDK
ncbi:MAG: hypothetical protein SOT81_07090 [Treponema sp.]|nr:hypothetical protein [Treponema sp.]